MRTGEYILSEMKKNKMIRKKEREERKEIREVNKDIVKNIEMMIEDNNEIRFLEAKKVKNPFFKETCQKLLNP